MRLGREDPVVLAFDEELRGLGLGGLEQPRTDGREVVVVPARLLQCRELLEGGVRVRGPPLGLEAANGADRVERTRAAFGSDHAAAAGKEREPRIAVLRVSEVRRDVGAQSAGACRRLDDLRDLVLELTVMANVVRQVSGAVDDVHVARGVGTGELLYRTGRSDVLPRYDLEETQPTLLFMIEPLVKFLEPVIYLFHPDAGVWLRIYFLLVALWTLVTWAFFGAAITRMAAVQYARNDDT